MRSNLIQQVDKAIALVTQVLTMSGSALVKKGAGFVHVNDNGALGLTKSMYLVINAGVSSGATATIVPTIQESDDDTDGNYATVTLTAALPTISLTSSAGSTVGYFIKTAGLKKYIRVIFTCASAGATDTIPVSAVAILGDGSVMSLPRGATAPVVYAKA
jgi:hypothetical protein